MEQRVNFEAFVVARGAALVRFAHGLSGDRATGEDLCQSVLIKTHARWDKIHSDPERYVRAAIVRELTSWRRRRSRSELPGEVPDRQVQDPTDAVAEQDAMWRVLQQLPLRQRAVLVLRYWQGCLTQRSQGCSSARSRPSVAAPHARSRRCGNIPIWPI